jgi:hypothetical protein
MAEIGIATVTETATAIGTEAVMGAGVMTRIATATERTRAIRFRCTTTRLAISPETTVGVILIRIR